MEKTAYEQFREATIERLVVDLRAALDRAFELSQNKVKRPTPQRLQGLKRAIDTALDDLAEEGFDTFNINDVIHAMRKHNYSLAKRIESDNGKKASLSSTLRRLSRVKGDRMIIMNKLGGGRRPTEYRFSDTVLAREARRNEQLGLL